ncbi:S-adenosyl-L-methionine-dependent methyltransferase [Chiua virens]|nr:S-adenosyl-L-methionine-dependent methyltransferase [Chiua virens]
MLEPADMHNEQFSKYYQEQKIIPDDEWDTFMDSLRRPLPTTFRIAGSRQPLGTLSEIPTFLCCTTSQFEDEVIPPPSQISWYPDGLAWQFNVSKKVLRTSPEFKKFHSFLVHETEVGNISRQEAVSMLPPLLLDVQPHHKVIDLCAAPGSKTAQILEALHANDTATATSTPPGLLIANDSDSRRSQLLIHQSARLPSPSFMVTNLDASIYPVLRSATVGGHRSVKGSPSQLLFDRILCDVPCSGDGTLRKNVGIWKRWQPLDGNGLHGLQVRILQRAMRMLEPDGRIVYSTCSLNPVENEAVIAAALNSHPEFELMDVSSQLPGLICRPGITNWSPTVGRSIDTSYPSWAAYIESIPEDKRSESKMLETHWPPSNAGTLNLERWCVSISLQIVSMLIVFVVLPSMRIYPHLQDTGGFFVAVLERKESHRPSKSKLAGKRAAEADATVSDSKKLKLDTRLPSDEHEDVSSAGMSSAEPSTAVVGDDTTTDRARNGHASKPKLADPSFKEMPYTFLQPDDPALVTCIQQLHLTTDFPTTNVLVRNPDGDPVRSFYITNDLVKSVITHNDASRMRLMTSGTKVITKQDAGRGMDAQFRILGEGLPVVLPYIPPATIMTADFQTLRVLLQTYYPLCVSFAEPFRSAIEAKGTGNHVVRFPASQSGDTTLSQDLMLPLWKSNVSVTLMIDKKAKSALSLRLFGEDMTIATREAGKQKKSAAAASSSVTQLTELEPQLEQDDKEEDENDDMDTEEQ